MRERLSVFGINMAQRSNRRWLVVVTYLSLLGVGVVIETDVELEEPPALHAAGPIR